MVNTIMWKELTKIELCDFFLWIIEIICLGYPSPMEKVEKSKNDNLYVLMNFEIVFLIYPFLHREYYLFGQKKWELSRAI